MSDAQRDQLNALRREVEGTRQELERYRATLAEARAELVRTIKDVALLPPKAVAMRRAVGWACVVAIVTAGLCSLILWRLPALLADRGLELEHRAAHERLSDVEREVSEMASPYGDVEGEIEAIKQANHGDFFVSPTERRAFPGLTALHGDVPGKRLSDILSRWAYIGVAACRVGEAELAGFSIRVLSWVNPITPGLDPSLHRYFPIGHVPSPAQRRAAAPIYDACDERGLRITPSKLLR